MFGVKFLKTMMMASVVSGAAFVGQVSAESAQAIDVNKGRIGLLTATSTGTHSAVGADMARILDGKSKLRVVPYLGLGSVQNIEDLMTFRHADMALINSDALISRRLQNQDDERLDRIRYMAKLFSIELHVIARTDGGVNSISDLNGRRVATGEGRSGSFLTSSLLLRSSGVRATAIALPDEEGLEALKEGVVDAVFVLAGKPSALLRQITSDEELLLINIPLTDNIRSVYGTAQFTSDDYPNLVRDKFVETVSVDVILAAYGNPPKGSQEYKTMRAFVEELDNNTSQFLRPPSHPKWADFSLETEVTGLERHDVVASFLSGTEEEEAPQLSIEDLMRQTTEQ